MKKIIGMIFLSLSVFVLAACSSGKKGPVVANNDGSILKYDKTNAPDGYYVMKKDGVMNPLLSAGLANGGDGLYLMYTDYDQLIPTLSGKSQLVTVAASNPPSEYTLHRLSDIGWTVGVNFNVPTTSVAGFDGDSDNDKEDYSESRVTFGSTLNSLSPIEKYFQSAETFPNGYQAVWIDNVNNEKITPSMVTSGMGFLKGLQKKAMYSFGVYNGTKYQKIEVQADTHVFESTGETYTVKTIKTEKDTYFTLKLPNDLPNGYYALENYGVFKYEN